MPAVNALSRPHTKPATNFPTGDTAAMALLRELPKAAQEKFAYLQRIETRATALRSGLYDAMQIARENRDSAAADLARYDRDHPLPEYVLVDDPKDPEGPRIKAPPEQPPQRAEIVARLERHKADLARLKAEHDSTVLGFATANILDWLLEEGPSAKFIGVTPPKLDANLKLAEALDRNRSDQQKLFDERRAIASAPLTAVEAKAAMRAQVASLAALGKPDILPLGHGGGIGWPTTLVTMVGLAGTNPPVAASVSETLPDAAALFLWAQQSAIIAALEKEIDAAFPGDGTLSAEAKKARSDECDARLLSLQRVEEAIICRLEGDGATVRRVDPDPAVLLGIEWA